MERVHADIAGKYRGQISGGVRKKTEALDIGRETYNQVRRNKALGMRTSAEVHRLFIRKYTGDYGALD